ncbi:MAG: chemotaxis protein CheW [Alphaproteobacteria bacterium]|nr:chemotaxis protein CheW [Alphaproteobacteria bacterium]
MSNIRKQDSQIAKTKVITGQQILTTFVGDQKFGVPVLTVQDILRPRNVAAVPKAPPDVAGLINLRGRIVTVVDLRQWLGFGKAVSNEQMHVVIECEGEHYSFLVDSVGDVVTVDTAKVEAVPPSLPSSWKTIANSVVRHEDELILIIDVSVLISTLATV